MPELGVVDLHLPTGLGLEAHHGFDGRFRLQRSNAHANHRLRAVIAALPDLAAQHRGLQARIQCQPFLEVRLERVELRRL